LAHDIADVLNFLVPSLVARFTPLPLVLKLPSKVKKSLPSFEEVPIDMRISSVVVGREVKSEFDG
jgi:hypothetical protein